MKWQQRLRVRLKKKPYSKRTDVEKLLSNWKKTLGLLADSQYSMAIIRAGTCAEIAANIVVRAELVQKRQLEPRFVDGLLRWANGLQGKYSRLILPILSGTPAHSHYRKLQAPIQKLNDVRNEIAHGGRFASKATATKLILLANRLCVALSECYVGDLNLKKP